jgi:hypothetical protein
MARAQLPPELDHHWSLTTAGACTPQPAEISRSRAPTSLVRVLRCGGARGEARARLQRSAWRRPEAARGGGDRKRPGEAARGSGSIVLRRHRTASAYCIGIVLHRTAYCVEPAAYCVYCVEEEASYCVEAEAPSCAKDAAMEAGSEGKEGRRRTFRAGAQERAERILGAK